MSRLPIAMQIRPAPARARANFTRRVLLLHACCIIHTSEDPFHGLPQRRSSARKRRLG